MNIKTTVSPSPGDVIHFTRTGILWASSLSFSAPHEVSRRGETVTLTADIIAASLDRHGANSWLGLTEEEQISRWGSEVYRPGAAPQDLTTYTPDSTEADVAYGERRTAAWAIGDPERRAEALADLRRDFGTGPSTSRTVRTESGDYR